MLFLCTRELLVRFSGSLVMASSLIQASRRYLTETGVVYVMVVSPNATLKI